MGLFLTLAVFLLAFAGNDWLLEYCPWPIGIICKGLVDGEIKWRDTTKCIQKGQTAAVTFFLETMVINLRA